MRVSSWRKVLPVLGVALLVGGCEYLKLLRPSVLKQLNPDVVRLVNTLPDVDDPNEAIVARLFAHGGLSHAELGRDGVFRDKIWVPENEFIWKPAIIRMARGGELELEFHNVDQNFHIAFVPGQPERQVLQLPVHTAGRVRIRLDQPGLYWFGCPVSDHAGRGMLGLIMVGGEVPESARLDRPRPAATLRRGVIMPHVHHRRLRALSGMAVFCVAAVACRSMPEYPLTQEAVPMSALNDAARGAAPPVARAVTAERIARARSEPQNWLTYYGAYDGQRYSSLDEINTTNVARLRPAWVFQQGVIGLIANPATYSFEAAPIVVDGVMFVSGWDGYVWALDAVTGELLWQYRHSVPLDIALCCGNVNRGVAVAHGRVFYATPNGHLVALDATDGRPVWEQVFVDVRAGESATLAPLVVKNLVIVGSSGAEYGVRGHIDAFDIDTGERVWRRYNVPRPGEPGSETWEGDSWERGGGTAWITGTYDPQLDLLYWGIGNPGPVFDPTVRAGDNLYTSSVVALDPDDGSLRWHYQFTPGDVWDYDGVNENILFEQDGRRLLAHFDKNGYLFILDRTNGELVRAVPFGRTTWGRIDAATGAVTVERTPTTEGTHICPGPAGLKEWPHASYSPATGLLYTPVVEVCGTFKLIRTEYRESMPYWGGEVDLDEDQWGHVKAFDPGTGREVWSWDAQHPIVASLLTTAGGLVFAGEPSGMFHALHARTGEVLWSFNTGSGIHSNPVTYSADGKQYVAVPTGWGGWVEGYAPEMYGAPRGTALFVFALP